jgi:streptogramin lyase
MTVLSILLALTVTVSGPRTIDMGDRWRATVTVRAAGKPYGGAAPRITLRQGREVHVVFTRRVRRGVFRTNVPLPFAGRWAVTVHAAGRAFARGTLTLRPALTGALDVAVLPDGELLVGDRAHYVLRAAPNGRPSVLARVLFPVEVAPDPLGGYTVVSEERYVRRIAPGGAVSTLAELQQPTAHAHDASGNTYASELGGRVVRVDRTTGAVTQLATGLDRPHGLVVDADGNVVVCETLANRVVRIAGGVTTLADGLNQPVDVARAPDGSLVVAEGGGNRIARIGRDRSVTTLVSAVRPQAVAVDAQGRVYYTEGNLERVLRFDPATNTVAAVLGKNVPS